ncbi:MAG: response regulator transcription factor [Desulfotalea sp.]
MNKAHVLIVEDEADIQQLVSYNLIRANYHVTCADSGEEALKLLATTTFDCILLDIMLPGLNGIEVCSTIRSEPKNKETGIIMMTAKGEEEDIVGGLETGADDYITKPFSPKVLVARVKAVLRRQDDKDMGKQKDDYISIANLEIDKGRHEVLVAGEEINLTVTEFGILALLAEKPGWVFSRQQIIDAVRGYDFLVTPRAIDVQIFGLRKKLNSAGQMIETVRGVGYKFSPSKN